MNTFSQMLSRVACLALLAALAAAQAAPTVATGPKQALAEARALAAQSKGKTGPERAAALEAGAKAYQQVATNFGADTGVVAEASFEAAELWRRKGALADAEAAYRLALDNDPARYEPRACLELAHLLRRGKKFDAAVEQYRKVAGLQPGSARAHAAQLWIGRTQQTASKIDDAIAAFDVAVQSAPTPASLITAGNWLAKAKIKKGDYAGARAAIADIEKRAATDVAGDSPAAKRLQTALAEMSARRSLQRSLDKKSNAAADALDVEDVEDPDDVHGDKENGEEKEGAGNGTKPDPKKSQPKSPVKRAPAKSPDAGKR